MEEAGPYPPREPSENQHPRDVAQGAACAEAAQERGRDRARPATVRVAHASDDGTEECRGRESREVETGHPSDADVLRRVDLVEVRSLCRRRWSKRWMDWK